MGVVWMGEGVGLRCISIEHVKARGIVRRVGGLQHLLMQ